MKEEAQSMTQRLYQTLLNQNEVLADIISQQQILHAGVMAKNWEQVERAVSTVNMLSERFSALENDRTAVFALLCPKDPDDIYAVTRAVSSVFKRPIMEVFHQVRQKLAVSKIENDVLNEYIRITQGFLQGVFETVLPQRRNTLYSPAGTVVKTQPESVVVNTVI
ncbi:hypothetical protein H0R92_11200 [Treponema sp. OMZ 840]|uniref:hypothetical protein n=1 Tax=Treponema sp. OMZ 840 TaxID=244313 RepID=UPI003D911446